MTTYYVNPSSGNDANSGTYASPFLTVSAANSASSDGDTIEFSASAPNTPTTYNMTKTTMSYFIQSRTYQGETDDYGRRLITLDLQGAFVTDCELGDDGKTLILQDFKIANINTTALTAMAPIGASQNHVFRIASTSMNITLRRCHLDNIAVGANTASSNTGLYGVLFGTFFNATNDTLQGSTITFDDVIVSRLGRVSGAAANVDGFWGSFGAYDSVNMVVRSLKMDVTDPGFGGGQITQVFAARDFGTHTAVQAFDVRDSVFYMSSGSCALTRHAATSGSGTFDFDADYADNYLYGTWSIDNNASYTINDVSTIDPDFVAPADQNYNFKSTTPVTGTGYNG